MSRSASPADQERIVMADGGGGERMQRLIRAHLVPKLGNELLAPLADGAIVPWDAASVVMTTDSYVVTPLEFPGGDIGRLAIAGTVNDLAVMGAAPIAISLGLILEEGLSLEVLDRVIASIAATSHEAHVQVVTGDTKVIERREHFAAGDDGDPPESGMLINTTGIGKLRVGTRPAFDRVHVGDCVLMNGRIAEHGLAIMARRSGIEFETPLMSDVAPLDRLVGELLESGADVKFMRDATRGGLAGVLADISDGSDFSIEVDESAIPLSPVCRHAAEMLGLDPLAVANEGKIVCVVAAADCDIALAAMRRNPLGRYAACIGKVTDSEPPLVELITRIGGRRIIQRPYGEELPRIC